MATSGAEAWNDAALVATLLAIDPAGLGGASLHARAGPVRDAWLALFRSLLPSAAPLRRVPLHISDERLLGGLDWLGALHNGSVAYCKGALAETDGGFIVLPSAERTSTRLRSHLTAAVDEGEIRLERDGMSRRVAARFGIIALDESVDEEAPVPPQLLDRLAFLVNLSERDELETQGNNDVDAVLRARARLPHVAVTEDAVQALCDVASRLGIASLRASIFAVNATRAIAALAGRTTTTLDDAQVAARLVLTPRATQIPSSDSQDSESTEANESPQPPDEEASGGDATRDDSPREDFDQQPSAPDDSPREDTSPSAEDMVLAAALAALPFNLLERIARQPGRKSSRDLQGRAGALRQAASRGRPVGTRAGKPGGGVRLNLVETLRAAAPWQRVRRAADPLGDGLRVRIRTSDLRITRYKQRAPTVTVFLVDASGSAALNRLAEAKGAVELLLADCYIRRDQVSVIAFRGTSAQLILAPTRSLVRAKRQLADLAGGGPTPLAAALQLSCSVVEQSLRAGHSVTQVVLTDGSANVALDGSLGRAGGEADAHTMALRIHALAASTILIDISNRAQPKAETLARTMGARYVWLPYADARSISGAVKLAGQTA